MKGWKLLCSGLVFVAVSTTVAAGLGSLGGGIRGTYAWLSLAAGFAAAPATWRSATAPRAKIGVADAAMFAVFGLAALRAFLWVIYAQDGDVRILSPHNLGDISLHLNLITRWAHGGSFWPENPFMSGGIFPYHPGMDLWNALLARAGVPIWQGLRWAGLLGSAAAAAALWRWGRGFAVAAFLFAGGLASLVLLAGKPVDAMEDGVVWKNLFLAMFVTQRGLLYSLPAGLVLMCVWRAQLRGDEGGPSLAVPAQVALYATMPLFNAPAFLFLSALLVVCFAASWRHRRARPFFAVGAASVIPAAWLVSMVTAHFQARSALRFLPSWMQDMAGPWFWLWSFGLLPPLLLALGAVVLRPRGGDGADRVFFLVGTGTMLFCFFFAIAPWPWDNTKLMLWGYLAVAPLLWTNLVAKWPTPWRTACCLALFAPGALTLASGLGPANGYRLADGAELADAQFMLEKVPVNARVACAPLYNHPAILLGHPVAMGHDGHLFSQGLEYGAVQHDLDTLMTGADGWKSAARRLGTRHLLWGPYEEQKWPASAQPWKDCARIVAATEKSGTLYDITPCLLQD